MHVSASLLRPLLPSLHSHWSSDVGMALLFFSEITIAASFRDLAAIAVTLVVSVAASS